MNKEDFQLRVHIIEGRDLKGRDMTGMSDPICFVQAFDQKQHTDIHKQTTICTWDRMFIFKKQMLKEQFLQEKIVIQVYDANTIFRNVLIGGFEFDVAMIHKEKNHEIYRKWVALSDTTDKNEGIQGYVKLSIIALCPGDEAPHHNEEEEADEDLEGAVVLTSPNHVKVEEYFLKLGVYKAQNLPKTDTFGKCDGKVSIKFAANDKLSTKVINKDFNPVWNEELCVPFNMPTMSDVIKVHLYDDDIGKDDLLGTLFFSLKEVMERNVKPTWYPIYGASDSKSTSKYAPLMNTGVIQGSSYKGSVLLSLSTEKTYQPKLSKKNLVELKEELKHSKYTLRVDLFEATELVTDSDIIVELSVGTQEVHSETFKVKDGYSKMFHAFKDWTLDLPDNPVSQPLLFINFYKNQMLKGKKRIGFIILKLSEIKNDKEAFPKWEVIKPDIFNIKEEKNPFAGFVLYKVSFGEASQVSSIPRQQLTAPVMNKFQLRALIYQGKELISGDKSGSSDPYCIIRCGKAHSKTQIIKETTYPSWYQVICLNVELPENKDLAPQIVVDVFDYDNIGEDEFLGRFKKSVAAVSDKLPEKPEWYPLTLKNGKQEGHILAAFQLLGMNESKNVPIPVITPKLKNCKMAINLVGARNLKPYHFLKIGNSRVEFDVGDMKKKLTTKNSDKPSGHSPNYLEHFEFDIQVPQDLLFVQPINFRVFDKRLLASSLVATRSTSLFPYVTWANKEEARDVLEAEVSNIDSKIIEKIPGSGMIAVVGEKAVKMEQNEIVLEEEPHQETKTEDNNEMNKKNEMEIERIVQEHNNNVEEGQQKIEMKEISVPTQGRTIKDVEDTHLEVPNEIEEDVVGLARFKRKILAHELEKDFEKPPFLEFNLKRGTDKNNIAGVLKANIAIWGAEEKPVSLPDVNTLGKEQNVILRVYVLEGEQLVANSKNGLCKPYLKLSCGKGDKLNIEDKQHTSKKETLRPKFYRSFEFAIVLPTNNKLSISVWDDKIGFDDMIGETVIDLENRFYSEEWKQMEKKHIESRTLWNPSSSNPQGKISLWVDILTPEEAHNNPIINITPPPPQVFEVRLTIWDTKDVQFRDEKNLISNKMSDVFISAYVEGVSKPQKTDIHWRCEDGKALFNWRLIFRMTLPSPHPRLKIQMWDKDIIAPNDAICEANLNIKKLCDQAYKKFVLGQESKVTLDRRFIDMFHPNYEGVQGRLNFELCILSENEANQHPVGIGRSAPEPLDPPNRPKTSFNPLRMDKMVTNVCCKWLCCCCDGCIIN